MRCRVARWHQHRRPPPPNWKLAATTSGSPNGMASGPLPSCVGDGTARLVNRVAVADVHAEPFPMLPLLVACGTVTAPAPAQLATPVPINFCKAPVSYTHLTLPTKRIV